MKGSGSDTHNTHRRAGDLRGISDIWKPTVAMHSPKRLADPLFISRSASRIDEVSMAPVFLNLSTHVSSVRGEAIARGWGMGMAPYNLETGSSGNRLGTVAGATCLRTRVSGANPALPPSSPRASPQE